MPLFLLNEKTSKVQSDIHVEIIGTENYLREEELRIKYDETGITFVKPLSSVDFVTERDFLIRVYLKILNLVCEHKLDSVAIPALWQDNSDKNHFTFWVLDAIKDFLKNNDLTVFLCFESKSTYGTDSYIIDEIFLLLNPPARRKSVCSPKSISYDVDFGVVQERADDFVEAPTHNADLRKYLQDMDKPFVETLFLYIDNRGMTDVECYKKANVDRKTFSKLKSNPNQRPTKQIALAFAIALELSLDETQHLLSTAGMTLSRSITFDKIIRYFIKKRIYDIYTINEALFEFDQPLLGSI